MRIFCSFSRKTQTSLGEVLVITFVTACYRALSLTDSKCDFLQSRSEHTDISEKGVCDGVSHCMLSGFESYGYRMRLFRSLGRKMLTSSRKVQVTTIVTGCYWALSLTDSK